MNLKKIKVGLLFVAVFQIFLLINFATAHSYLIHQTDNLIEEQKIIDEEKDKFNLLKSGINLLVGLLSIKQIGIVSAEEDAMWYCCKDTCDPIISTDTGGCDNIIETDCESTFECETGCCIDPDIGLCSTNSPRGKCTEDGGEWNEDKSCSIPECQQGCCVLGSNAQFTTASNCEILSSFQGFETDFRQILNELECLALSASQFEGACIIGEQCIFTTEEICLSRGGKPYVGYLCSYPELNTNCEKQFDKGCVEGQEEIYWFDSCGNKENIYDSDKDKSWNEGKVLSKEESCDYGGGNIDSSSCGNCLLPLSRCSETGLGDFVCKGLSCENAPANVGTQDRINGETWCLYDGYVGEGKDTVGSEHWLAYCFEGEVEIDRVDASRGFLCQQSVIEEESKTISVASRIINDASKCLTYNPLQENEDGEIIDNEENINKCQTNKHCMAKNVEVGEYFKFDMCVPKYPKGDGLIDGVDDGLCSLHGSDSCTVYYKKNILGNWVCEENCECETNLFAEQMNELCISVGDCGSQTNYIGTATNNIQITGLKGKKLEDGEETDEESDCPALTDGNDCEPITVPGVNLKNYEEYAKPKKDQYVETQNIGELLALIGISEEEYQSGNISHVLDLIGTISGAGGGLIFSGSKLLGLGLLEAAKTGGVLAGTLTAVASIAAGVAIGNLIANWLGLQNEAAITMMISGGMAGAGVAILLMTGTTSSWNPVGWILLGTSVIVGILVALTGWGEMETRIVEFDCMPWQAPTFSKFSNSNSNCAKCNEDPLRPCTEYRCSSLGQTCEILNENEVNPPCESIEYETNPPIISAKEIATQGYEFAPENFVDKKIEIISTMDECIQEYSRIHFTLKTDESARCKYSFETPLTDYEDMSGEFPLEQNAFTEDHTFIVDMPSLDSPFIYDITGDLTELSGSLNMYVKCEDYWENYNIDEYIIKFRIAKEDGTAVNHALTTTNPRNGATLEYGTHETDFTMWINEPAECKYDIVPNKDYDEMANDMECEIGLDDRTFEGWPCSTTLENLGDTNNFYFRCKDKPWVQTEEDIEEYGERNVNEDDYDYVLYSSKNELKIDAITFNSLSSGETIESGFEPISVNMEVTTSGGAHNGESFCYWGVLEDGSRDMMFPFTPSSIHTKLLTPRLSGTHTNYIECEDNAGNKASSVGQFTIHVDGSFPEIARAYYEGGKLNLITSEIAQCYYDFNICSFSINDETMKFDSVGYSAEHSTNWVAGQTYNVKCEDVWGNINPSGCDIRIISSS